MLLLRKEKAYIPLLFQAKPVLYHTGNIWQKFEITKQKLESDLYKKGEGITS